MLLLVMRKPKYYTIRKRKDCNRWELFINDTKGFGIMYGGLFATKEGAEQSAEKDWGLTVFRGSEAQKSEPNPESR